MTLEQLVHGLEIGLACALRTRGDLRLQAGALN
jgi:hypothetical protein